MAYDKIRIPEEGDRITVVDGELRVPDVPIIGFIEGDGSGPDVWNAARVVLEAAVDAAYGDNRRIAWMELFAGGKANEIYGEDVYLPEETLEALGEFLVGIKGPLATPVAGGLRSLNVALRKELDLYACVRPVRHYKGVPSPIEQPEYVDMVVFRENTEDVYAGIEWEAGSDEAKMLLRFMQDELGVTDEIRFPETSAFGIKPVSEEGTKRLMRSAIRYAMRFDRDTVTLVHKGAIMKHTEDAFREWGYEVAEQEFADEIASWRERDLRAREQGEYLDDEDRSFVPQGKILVNDLSADAFLNQSLLRPGDFDVVVSTNLNGDYVSDLLAAQVGGIGISPGGNINYETGRAVFEATHGTAPDLAGKNKANPSSLILSGEMMFRYLGWDEAADAIISAMNKTILSKTVTVDFARMMDDATEVGSREFAEAVVEKMGAQTARL